MLGSKVTCDTASAKSATSIADTPEETANAAIRTTAQRLKRDMLVFFAYPTSASGIVDLQATDATPAQSRA